MKTAKNVQNNVSFGLLRICSLTVYAIKTAFTQLNLVLEMPNKV